MAVCTVQGTIKKLDDTPSVGQQVIATIVSTEDDQGGQVAGDVGVTDEPIEAFTDENGEFTIDLIQGARVVLSIPAINLRKEVVVPNEDTAYLVDLI